MERTEALRSIAYDLVEYIQKRVSVDFDNGAQRPISFLFKGNTHNIGEVLGRFRLRETSPSHAFLVCTGRDEVYFLYFHDWIVNHRTPFYEGCWVLSFRILTDRELMALYREERKMLVHATFKKVVDFHGHLCPDLVLGGKACQYAQDLLSSNGQLEGGISIIAENSTSALDAIQVMLGATIGNQRLKVKDYGKHNYTFIGKNGHAAFRLSLRPRCYGDEEAYNALEQKIVSNQAVLDDVVRFQELLDSRINCLFGLTPEVLYTARPVEPRRDPTELASVYLTCCRCGEQVLKSHIVEHGGAIYCTPCFHRINIDTSHFCVH